MQLAVPPAETFLIAVRTEKKHNKMRHERNIFGHFFGRKNDNVNSWRNRPSEVTYHFENAAERLDDILAEECRVSLSNVLGDTVDEIQNRKFDIGLNLYGNKLTPL